MKHHSSDRRPPCGRRNQRSGNWLVWLSRQNNSAERDPKSARNDFVVSFSGSQDRMISTRRASMILNFNSQTNRSRNRQMRSYAKIIIERQNDDHWHAWFVDTPKQVTGGKWPADALARLLLLFGADEFETDETSTIMEATRPGHLECRIPFRRLKVVPTPSVN